MRKYKEHLILAGTVVLACMASNVLAVTYDVNDPTGLHSQINSANVSIAQQVGNFSIARFNAHPNKLVITADPQNGYGVNPDPDPDVFDQLSNVNLHAAVSGVDLQVTFDFPRISDLDQNSVGFGRITNEWWASGQDASTSSPWCMMYASAGTSKIIFSKNVYGIGFTINRLQANCTIQLFDAAGVQVGTDYTVASNSPGTTLGHSFFGYYYHKSPLIRSIKFGLGGPNNQFALDDVTVVESTAGLPACYGMGEPGDFNDDCTVNMKDFAVIAGNWLKCNDPTVISGCQ